MYVNIMEVKTTALLVVLVIIGLIMLLKWLYSGFSKAAQRVSSSSSKFITYKSLLLAAAIMMLVMWGVNSQTFIPEIDRYVLSFWPLILAVLIFFAADKTAKDKQNVENEHARVKAEEELKEEYKQLSLLYEREKKKNERKKKK